jgi:hypothetical protein
MSRDFRLQVFSRISYPRATDYHSIDKISFFSLVTLILSVNCTPIACKPNIKILGIVIDGVVDAGRVNLILCTYTFVNFRKIRNAANEIVRGSREVNTRKNVKNIVMLSLHVFYMYLNVIY